MHRRRGRLHVYLGAAPGVGKTYAMLAEAERLASCGVDVVVGLVETHGRSDTEKMLQELEVVPLRLVSYRGRSLTELDLDAVAARKPSVVVVDELAHSNVPGSRHSKRWEDVDELLGAGIDVITSLNVQHIDSLSVPAGEITGARQTETVPDAYLASAQRVDFVDVEPRELRCRIGERQVVSADVADVALAGFFSEKNLLALGDLARTWLEERGIVPSSTSSASVAAGRANGPVIVALTGAPEAAHLLRRAAWLAASLCTELIGVHVREPSDQLDPEPTWLPEQRRLLAELGGSYSELYGIDVASTVIDFARRRGAGDLVLGATRRSAVQELMHGSVIRKAIRSAGTITVHVVPAGPLRRVPNQKPARGAAPVLRLRHRVALPFQRRLLAWVLVVVAPVVIALTLVPFRSSLGLTGALLCSVLAVVGVALVGGMLPAIFATVVCVLMCDFYFAPPLHSFRVADLVDVVALVTFAVVAVVVGGLIDRSTRQGVRVVRADAAAENLARMAADNMASVSAGEEDPSEGLKALVRTFELEGATLMTRQGSGWRAQDVEGHVSFHDPNGATESVEVAPGRVLAIEGPSHRADDSRLLGVFLQELRLARSRAILEAAASDQTLDRRGLRES